MKLSEKELCRILEHGRHFPFLTSKERSVRDTVENRQMNLVKSPEILSFCRRKMQEWDQREEPDLCTRSVQELVNQWLPGRNVGDLTQIEQEDDFKGHRPSRKLGWCPMKNQWVSRCMGGAEGTLGRKRSVEANDGKRHRHHSNGMILNPSLRYRTLPRSGEISTWMNHSQRKGLYR
jgi:hypothetical protein